MLYFERYFSATYTFAAFRHIKCISGAFKIDFSTFCDSSFSSIPDGIFSYHYSGYLGLSIDPQNAKSGSR